MGFGNIHLPSNGTGGGAGVKTQSSQKTRVQLAQADNGSVCSLCIQQKGTDTAPKTRLLPTTQISGPVEKVDATLNMLTQYALLLKELDPSHEYRVVASPASAASALGTKTYVPPSIYDPRDTTY